MSESYSPATRLDRWRRARSWAGRLAIGLSTLFSCLWAYWGVTENFYEGWYYPSLVQNLLLAGRYLMWAGIYIGLSLIAVRFPRVGGALHGLAGAWSVMYYDAKPASVVMFAAPLFVIGLLYGVGRVPNLKWAYGLTAGLPLLISFLVGVEPILRIASRVNDQDAGARVFAGNDVKLVWAPAGPGWPRQGSAWETATRTCRHLSADGLTMNETEIGDWRLPSVDEVARSMTRHGNNVEGEWTPGSDQITYRVMPDKESPLWDSYSPVIYWWTSTEINEETAYMVSFSGLVLKRSKAAFPDYYGFRCVKDP